MQPNISFQGTCFVVVLTTIKFEICTLTIFTKYMALQIHFPQFEGFKTIPLFSYGTLTFIVSFTFTLGTTLQTNSHWATQGLKIISLTLQVNDNTIVLALEHCKLKFEIQVIWSQNKAFAIIKKEWWHNKNI